MCPELDAPVRFGVLGCADIARRRMLPTLAASPGVRLIAIASRDGAKAAAFANPYGCGALHGYESLLASPEIEAVYIPLPTMLHAEWIERALMTGKHVLAEKPLSGDRKSTARLLRLARSRGLVLMENVGFPFHSQHAAVQKLLADGAIGELRDFSSAFTVPPLPADNNRYQPDVGGGALLDGGIYPVRAAIYYLGDQLEVIGAILRCHGMTGVVVSGRILAHTRRGVTADLRFGMAHSYRTSCEFAGSEGRLMLDRVFTPPPTFQPVARIERQDHREEITLSADDQFARAVTYFVRAIRAGEAAETAEAAEVYAKASMQQARLVAAVEEKALRFTC
jgi:dTDP-3,4-didehydro-2,6-dideoxy-alpha-D-glucose 3-reductase